MGVKLTINSALLVKKRIGRTEVLRRFRRSRYPRDLVSCGGSRLSGRTCNSGDGRQRRTRIVAMALSPVV
jgi:hypothetical protein